MPVLKKALDWVRIPAIDVAPCTEFEMRKICLILLGLSLSLPGCDSGAPAPGPEAEGSKSVSGEQPVGMVDGALFVRQDSKADDEARARQISDALLGGLETQLEALKVEVSAAKTDEEKAAIYQEYNPVPGFLNDVVKTVDMFPLCNATFDVALGGLGVAQGEQRELLMDYLLARWPNRLDHRKLIEYLLEQVPSPAVEKWLTQIADSAPVGVVRAEALLAYKTYFDQKTVFSSTLLNNPEFANRLPENQLTYIHAKLTEQQTAQVAAYLERLIAEFADLEFTGSGLGSSDTFGEVAKYELFELNHLNVGDPAPNIVGQDLDGFDFQLSDYRGKVVMLDFWGQWCPPCRRMYPYERELVRLMNGLPFALLGVNSDRDLKVAQASVKDEKLPWRNFWNGPEGTAGPIAKLYNVSEWPTVYLIDAEGIIRFKGVLGNDIEKGIEVLMAEIGHDIDLQPVQKVASKKP